MSRTSKYDYSDTSYAQLMEQKRAQYYSLVRQAEDTNENQGGQVSKEEALYYLEAAKVCAEIINANTSQPAVRAQWQRRKEDCEDDARRIRDILDPPAPRRAPPAPKQPATPPKQMNTQSVGPRAKTEQESQTKSGFQTKNAVKEVPAEVIESWYQEKPQHGFEAVTGMEDLKERLMTEVASLGWDRIDETLDISPVQSYFFYGPPGSGKTFIIEAFAKELMDQGFKYIRLLGGDIHASLVGVAEKTVQIAFKEAIDNAPCVIFIDEVENVCVSRDNLKTEGHEKRLTVAFLEAYNMLLEKGKRVIFMGATNYPGNVDVAMLDRVKLVRVPLPPEETRREFFARQLSVMGLEGGFSYDEMAEITDNYSYRDLRDLTDAVKLRTKKQVIKDYSVEDRQGQMDTEQTDIAGSEALKSGEVTLNREFFEQVQRENVPSMKADIRDSLAAFEKKLGLDPV